MIETCKIIAAVVDNNENVYQKYVDFVKENASKSLEDILFIAMTRPVVDPVVENVATATVAATISEQKVEEKQSVDGDATTTTA